MLFLPPEAGENTGIRKLVVATAGEPPGRKEACSVPTLPVAYFNQNNDRVNLNNNNPENNNDDNGGAGSVEVTVARVEGIRMKTTCSAPPSSIPRACVLLP